MQNKVSNHVILLTLICSFIFLDCMTTSDIYTDSGELKRPTLNVEANLHDLNLDPISQNSVTELKAELVDGVNLPLLYSLVKSENPQFLAKMADVHVAEGVKIQSGTLENPEFRTYVNKMPLDSENSFRDGSVGIRILQPIDISGGIGADKKIARALHLKASWELIDEEQKIKILSTNAFFDYWYSMQIFKIIQRLKVLREQQYSIIAKELDAGKSTKVQLLSYHKLMTDASILYEDAKNNIEISKNNMKKLIGDFSLVFGDPVFGDCKFFDINKPDLEELVKNHPAYLSAMQNVTAYEAEQTKMNGQHLKKMKIGLGYEFENNGQNHWMNLLFEIPFPLWDFGKGNKYSAKARVFIAQMQAKEVLNNLLRDVNNALNRLQSLNNKLNLITVYLVEKQKLHKEIVKGQASVTTLFDTLKSEAEVIDYELKELDIRLERYKTFFYLHILMHGKFPEIKD